VTPVRAELAFDDSATTGRIALVTAGLAGFISLSYEILWYRSFSYASGTLPVVFGFLLFYFLIGLAAGAFASRRYCDARLPVGERSLLRRIGWLVLMATLVAFLVVPAEARLSATSLGFRAALPLVAIAAGMWGGVLPLVSHFAIAPDARAGRGVSYVYLANILGSVAGTLVTGFVLMDVWSMRTVALALVLSGVLFAGGLFGAGGLRGQALATRIGVLAVVAMACVVANPPLFDHLYERMLYKTAFGRDSTFRETHENRSGVINVSRSWQVFGGGVYDGVVSVSLLDDQNLIERAFAVGMMHPRPRQVLMIGLSGGAWAQVLVRLPGVEHLTVVEINPGYLKLMARHPAMAPLLTDPRADILVDDGRRWLQRNPGRRFDAIVANESFHWRAHSTNLLSVEFLQVVRAHLNPGGLFFFNTTDSPDAYVTAFTEFPHGIRVLNFAAVSDSEIGRDPNVWRSVLTSVNLGGRTMLDTTRAEDRARLKQLLALPASLNEPPRRNGWETRESVLRRLLGRGQVITDDNMLPEWRRSPFHR